MTLQPTPSHSVGALLGRLLLCLLLSGGLLFAAQQESTDAATPDETTQSAETQPAENDPPVADRDPDQGFLISGERPDVKPPIPGNEHLGGAFLKMLLALGIVIGAIFAFSYFAKRVLPKQFGIAGGAGNMRLVQNLALGPNRFISLVEVDGRRFLLGVTETQINLLNALDEYPFSQEMAEASDSQAVREPRTVRELMEEES
ncbi:flagellar biosynthetic protein FliO [Acanthopleuribacter pedis]|uniref:Flagellar protein n=1 Tax=Acanthopleuribacter pedis TaxID=442870 RepID=A0A8J7QC46_9BACT|nr:flagellar biosynthetic protein FliO [Acanthopleuribacter pedis]MBO1322936.1 flagellar biosynthetic protein FliO [Acanthopleuribacter pedis]